MNELKIFQNPELGEIRTVTIDGKPYFVGNDVARILEYARPSDAISSNCKGAVAHRILTNGGMQNMKVIPEGDMYRLIVKAATQSNSERVRNAAEKFETWVFDEVLPELRKNGNYEIQKKPDSYTIEDPAERARRWAEEYEEKKALEVKITELKPKGQYFDSLVDSKLLTTFRDTAKELHMPPKQFTQWLVDEGYVYRDRHNILKPYEQYRKNGLFKMKDFITPAGYSNIQTYVTVKGKETFRLLLSMDNRVLLE